MPNWTFLWLARGCNWIYAEFSGDRHTGDHPLRVSSSYEEHVSEEVSVIIRLEQ